MHLPSTTGALCDQIDNFYRQILRKIHNKYFFLDTIVSEINDQNIKMEKKYCYLFHFCRKDTNLFFLQTLPDNILLTSKNYFSLRWNNLKLFNHSDVFILSILKFQNNGKTLKKSFFIKMSIFLSNINLDRTTFHL